MATARSTTPLTLEVVELIGTVVARYHEEYEDAAAEHALTGAQARLLGLLSLEPLPMRKPRPEAEVRAVERHGDRGPAGGAGPGGAPPRPGRPPGEAGRRDGGGRPDRAAAARVARTSRASRWPGCRTRSGGAAGPAAADAGRGRGVLEPQARGLPVTLAAARRQLHLPRCGTPEYARRGRPSALRCTHPTRAPIHQGSRAASEAENEPARLGLGRAGRGRRGFGAVTGCRSECPTGREAIRKDSVRTTDPWRTWRRRRAWRWPRAGRSPHLRGHRRRFRSRCPDGRCRRCARR